ncbi:hypothetical protein BVRB_015490 [Beta vulgaris subsp. vulgaris]|uniref:Uncharacterized protein n=1 Tax=Beta vulgaris subsp. vulgaris TaxID=3555 RepID=A0A0J8B1A4_BETVV|nr:hypothetical protein BVRB_015490 [Beta vulgaris subsp. vulgaris]
MLLSSVSYEEEASIHSERELSHSQIFHFGYRLQILSIFISLIDLFPWCLFISAGSVNYICHHIIQFNWTYVKLQHWFL